uniref:Ankyrin repeat domain-containing protein 26-like n=1 Tax=Knipowitschia caucasica TaxID=637954 RepID=A0AAV2LHW0_KNICA
MGTKLSRCFQTQKSSEKAVNQQDSEKRAERTEIHHRSTEVELLPENLEDNQSRLIREQDVLNERIDAIFRKNQESIAKRTQQDWVFKREKLQDDEQETVETEKLQPEQRNPQQEGPRINEEQEEQEVKGEVEQEVKGDLKQDKSVFKGQKVGLEHCAQASTSFELLRQEREKCRKYISELNQFKDKVKQDEASSDKAADQEKETSPTEGDVERNRELEAEVQRPTSLELRETKQALKGKVQSLETQNRELTQEFESFKFRSEEKLRESRNEMLRICAENRELAEKFEEYRSESKREKSRLRTELESCKSDSQRRRQNVATDLEKTNAHLMEQLEFYKTDLENRTRDSGLEITIFKGKVDSLEKYTFSLEQKQRHHSGLQTEVESLRVENLEMKEALNCNKSELVRLRQTVAEAEKREQTLRNTVSLLETQKRDLSENLQRTEFRLNRLRNTGFDWE